MKRTIKFRGYNKKNNKWIYGYYLVNRGQHFVVEDGIANPLNTWEDYLVEADTIGQFTGLLDKNGVEIYEGDIMATDNDKKPMYLEICYIVEESSYFAKYRGSGIRMWKKWIDDFQKVVVGNIHDNPELINGKEKAK